MGKGTHKAASSKPQPTYQLDSTPGLLYLHSLQVLALEGHFCLMVHGDDQRVRGQELGAVVLLGESRAGEVVYFPSPVVLTTVLAKWLAYHVGTYDPLLWVG